MKDASTIQKRELSRLLRLAKAAAPGPWTLDGVPKQSRPIMDIVDAKDRTVTTVVGDLSSARLMAESREAIPRLIAEVLRLRGRK